MRTMIYTIQCAEGREMIRFAGAWLPKMGFEVDALVQVLPMSNGLSVTLCNENIESYSELTKCTREQNGKLMQVGMTTNRTTIQFAGMVISNGGLSIGDSVVIRYEYGNIQIRKLDLSSDVTKTRSLIVGKMPTDARIDAPRVRMQGRWLADIGFQKHEVATMETKEGKIILVLQEDGIKRYRDLVRLSRKNKMGIIQVSGHPKTPAIEIMGTCLKDAQIGISDLMIVSCFQGRLELQKMNFEQMGF